MNDQMFNTIPLELPLVTPAQTLAPISVFGLGYVGAVSMACLAELGHQVVGVDVDALKVGQIARGESPIVEDRLGELLFNGVARGLVNATRDARAAVLSTDMSFVSVGTPTSADGGCDMTFVRAVSRAIGAALAEKQTYHLVVMRCSVPPGTTLDVMVPELEAASGKRLGDGFGIAFNPEFLREGTAVKDFFTPTKTVIGANDSRAAAMLAAVYGAVEDEILYTTIPAAEMVKYVDNTWHATKVAFANEVGRLSKAYDVDSHAVMDIFVQDRHLNLSPYYLKPGFAFGGSCLPKEVRAMDHLAQVKGLSLPLMQSLTATNEQHIASALDMIVKSSAQTVGFLGVTFKPGTDDLRESPTLELIGACLEHGLTVKLYDANLRIDGSLDGHYAYMRHARPHLRAVIEGLGGMVEPSAAALTAASEMVVVSHAHQDFRDAVATRPAGVQVLDLCRLYKEIPADDAAYQGIGW